MLLVYIFDIYFCSCGEKLYGFIDVNVVNVDVVFQFNVLCECLDVVVVSGDIVNCGCLEEYQVVCQIFGSLNYLLYLIFGNYDDKVYFFEYFYLLCLQLGNDL